MESPWEGGNHGVTIGERNQQSHHSRVETTESPWESGNHRVTTGGCKPWSHQQEGGNHRVIMGE